MSRLPIAIAVTVAVLASCWLVSGRAGAVVIPVGASDAAGRIDPVKPVQSRRAPACHWERNYQTGKSGWVCRARDRYDVYPRYPRVVPRYRDWRRGR